MKLSGRGAALGVLAALWLAFALPGGLSGLELMSAIVAAAAGALGTIGWPVAGEWLRIGLDEWTRWIGDTPPERRQPAEREEDDRELAGAAVEDVLDTLGREMDARRMIIWRVDRLTEKVVPDHVLGELTNAQPEGGNPVAWAVRERQPMRIDPAPPWSRGDVVVAPIDDHRALTVETPPGAAPDPEGLESGARILAALLTLVDKDTDARAERTRLHRVTEFLQGLSRDHDPEQVPASLARAAIDLVDAQGALVGSWDGEEGMVLTREGDIDGPVPGDTFARHDGDLSHAARSGATLRRGPANLGERPPLAHDGEHWSRVVPYRLAVPFVGPEGNVGGVVAVWGDRKPSGDGVRLLEALGPLLSLQLRQATDLVRFRDRATADALTGLPNRAAFDDRMADEQARFHRYRRPAALMVIDLDHFKRVNDTYGHEAGDAVLRGVARTLQSTVRDVDVAARYGGEELVVLMPETMLRAARDVAERVRVAIGSTRVEHDEATISVTASIGVSACPEITDEPRSLFELADRALYSAKEEGRNRVVVADRT